MTCTSLSPFTKAIRFAGSSSASQLDNCRYQDFCSPLAAHVAVKTGNAVQMLADQARLGSVGVSERTKTLLRASIAAAGDRAHCEKPADKHTERS